jgi:hypothetical protein
VTFLSKIERHNQELRAAAQRGAGGGVAEPDVTKAYRDAVCPPADIQQPERVNPEDFRRGPVLPGHDALSPGYEPPLSFPVEPAGSFRGPASAASYVNGDCP